MGHAHSHVLRWRRRQGKGDVAIAAKMAKVRRRPELAKVCVASMHGGALPDLTHRFCRQKGRCGLLQRGKRL